MNTKEIDSDKRYIKWSEIHYLLNKLSKLGCIIVDDIYDTGETLQAYKEKGYEIASLYYRHGNLKQPDFWIEFVSNNDWLVFPWEI